MFLSDRVSVENMRNKTHTSDANNAFVELLLSETFVLIFNVIPLQEIMKEFNRIYR